MRFLTSWGLLLLAVLIAATLRLPMLETLPPGLAFDEAGNGVAALDVAQGDFRIWWRIGGGKEPLIAYLLQPLLWLLGERPLTLRLYAALWGIATVPALYFMARQLFPSTEGHLRHTWLPIFAAFGIATALWHVAYSRIAFRGLATPPLEALALGFLWRGLHTRSRLDFLIAGGLLGSLAYTYLPGRFVPLGLGLFFAVQALSVWRRRFGEDAGGIRPALLLEHGRNLTLLAGIAGLVFLPLAIYFLQNPGTFSERATIVSIFSPAVHQGDFWGLLGHTTLTTLGTFVGLSGDPNPFANLPGQPMVGPFLALFLLLGLLAALVRAGKPPYLFLLLWWPVMLLPGILAPEGAPHHLRLIGTAPGTYILIGLGITWGLERWQAGPLWQPGNALIGPLILALIFTPLTWQTYHAYFTRWATEIDHDLAYDVYAVELIDQLAAQPDPASATVIPMDLRAATEARHYTLDYLGYGQDLFDYAVVDEGTLAETLSTAARGKTTLQVVGWTQDKHRAADEKGLVAFLLDTGGAVWQGSETYPVYTVTRYRLPAEADFAFPAIERPLEVTLDNLIQLRRVVILPTPTVGGNVALGITFARIAPTTVDYKVSLRLVGVDDGVVAQLDRTLRHNWHQGTSLWPPEEVNEYYLLSPPPDAPTGRYTLRAVVYHPETLAPLTSAGLVEIELGEVLVGE